ncbi:2-oxoisovalerate dehydrogenase subunit alpha 2 like [Actinidia chinensis var. chinensis]|uniref:3-methyl-2-oxobutanoate dehydrogenase (2-methylpropanoyl-transferring) n=1 Tax=Actinidia chinensis var. chinensis TaxID=1590841 RepID=A0A2R6QYR0_ACTCC|nr:2-oxoisovalerate dehydrogenase subunit alpha 2 like [Actinidia chinensis var. chinensis]
MAMWITRPRNITHHLKTNIGFLEFFKYQRIWLRTSSYSNPLPSNLIAKNYGSTSPPLLRDWASFFTARRYKSENAAKQVVDEEKQALDFLGGSVTFTSDLEFISESPEKKVHCYRVLDDNGYPITSTRLPQVSNEITMKMYRDMVTLQIMDAIFYEAQRQGRICFYATTTGEEAVNIAPAAALTPHDVILPQYREPGVLLWRGFTLQEFANQLFANKEDYGKGRQMHVHYGSNKLNCFTMSAPIATQLPQAVGAAYSLKMEKKDACAVTFCGDGGTSEGDFHAALNFAAVMETPILFICRNNGWAISTPLSEQFRSDGIAVKGQAYGIRSTQVDGNDPLAVYTAVRAAREMAIVEQRPILIEALTYRVGHHSTSDDSTKYRPADEIEFWRNERNPVARFRKWIERNGWWSEKEDSQFRIEVRQQVMQAIQAAERIEKPPLSEMFTDVYDQTPSNLQEQEEMIREAIKRHPKDYPSDLPV